MKKFIQIFKEQRIIISLVLVFAIVCQVKATEKNKPATNGPQAVAPKNIQSRQFMDHKDWVFVENKGQLTADVKYYVHNEGSNVYCKPGMISFVFAKIENGQNQVSEATGFPLKGQNFESKNNTKITSSCMDLVFIGSNKDARVSASDQQSYYENYFTSGDANHGITDVHSFKKVIYKDIYPHIDMMLTVSQGQAMEYSFLVHPGGKVSDIKMHWNGEDAQEAFYDKFIPDNKKGGLFHYSAMGSIEESAPKSYACGKELKCGFVKNGDCRSFKIDGYDKTQDLLIDPNLEATYFGGTELDQANGVATDGSGNAYIAGNTASTSGIATSGAYQTSIGTGTYAFLAKFSSTGTESWATYYGAGTEQGLAICTDGTGNVYIAGITGSTTGIATSGAYQTTLGGGNDAFLAKFSSAGAISWATYYGGAGGYESAQGVATDATGNVYIAGYTNSTSGIATTGAYQTSLAGIYNMFLAKFSSAGPISWATYYGGATADAANGITADGDGNIYIVGYAKSTSGIATAGAYQTALAGGAGDVDGFLGKFTSSGAVSWATYYGGTSTEKGNGVTTDGSGHVYITGYTLSSNGIATSGAYQTSLTGFQDAFLAQFNSTGTESWATYLGGGTVTGAGVSTDGSNNIYLAGYTISADIVATSGAYQTSYGGVEDAFLAQFSSTGTEAWASYFGGNGVDQAFGVCTDHSGNVYIAGATESTNNIATPGAYQATNAGETDAFLTQFHFHTSGISPEINTDSYGLSIYPNPFINKAIIHFTLPEASKVRVSILDIQGKTLLVPADEMLGSGPNQIEIDATGAGLTPGTYFVNININDQVINRKIIEIR